MLSFLWCGAVLSCVWFLVTPWTVALLLLCPRDFSGQECWSGLLCPPSGNLPNPGTEPGSLTSPVLASRFFTTSATWEAQWVYKIIGKMKVKVAQSCPTFAAQGLYSPWNSPGQNTGVGSRSLLQGIFPAQGLSPGLPRCRRILYQLSHKGSLKDVEGQEQKPGEKKDKM